MPYVLAEGMKWVCDGTNDYVQIQEAINALVTHGGVIHLGPGTFDLASTGCTVWLPGTFSLQMEGEGQGKTVLSGSGNYLLDIITPGNTWTSGRLTLEHLSFSHNCPASGIGLDLTYGATNMNGVTVENTNATRTDKVGIKTTPPNNSAHQTWENVVVLNYGKGMWLGSDHILVENPVVSLCPQWAYGLVDYGFQILLLNPHVYMSSGEPDCCGYYCYNSGPGNMIVNPFYEPHASPHSGTMFYKSDGSNIIQVYGAQIWKDAPGFATIPLSNNYDMIKFINYPRRTLASEDKRTMNRSSYTTSGTGTDTTYSIPHGLCHTPHFCDAKATTEDADGPFLISVDSTNIILTYFDPPKSGTNNLSWTWEAEV